MDLDDTIENCVQRLGRMVGTGECVARRAFDHQRLRQQALDFLVTETLEQRVPAICSATVLRECLIFVDVGTDRLSTTVTDERKNVVRATRILVGKKRAQIGPDPVEIGTITDH